MARDDILRTELTTDPLALGYAAMTAQQAAAALNAPTRTVNREVVTASEVLNAINKAEFDALLPTDQALIWNVLHIGEINPFGIEADIFISVFGGSSTTIATLANVRRRQVSRGVELGLGLVKTGEVQEVRR